MSSDITPALQRKRTPKKPKQTTATVPAQETTVAAAAVVLPSLSNEGSSTTTPLTATPANAPIDNRRIFDEIQRVAKNHTSMVRFLDQLADGVQAAHTQVETLSRQVQSLAETVRAIEGSQYEHTVQLRDLRATSPTAGDATATTSSSSQPKDSEALYFFLVTNPNGVKLWTRVARDVELTIPYGHVLAVAAPFFRQWLDVEDVDAGIPPNAQSSFEKRSNAATMPSDTTTTTASAAAPPNKVEALCARVVFQKLASELYSNPSSFEQRQLILSKPIHRMYVALEYPTRQFNNVKFCSMHLPPLDRPIVMARDPSHDNTLQCVQFEGVKTIIPTTQQGTSLLSSITTHQPTAEPPTTVTVTAPLPPKVDKGDAIEMPSTEFLSEEKVAEEEDFSESEDEYTKRVAKYLEEKRAARDAKNTCRIM